MMQTSKKLLALLLGALMILASIGSLAEGAEPDPFSLAGALAAGQEVSFSVKGVWLEPPLVDEETSSAIVSLLDALEITGRLAFSESWYYFHADALLDGESALSIRIVSEDDTTYYVTPLLGGAIALSMDEYEAYMRNLGAVLDAQTDPASSTYSDIFGTIGGALASANTESAELVESAATLDETALSEILETYQIPELTAAIESWAETALVPEAYEGEIVSNFGVDANTAIMYSVDKQEMIDLISLLIPLLQENEALWETLLSEDVLGGALQTDGADPQETLAEIQQTLAMLPMLAGMSIPDETVLTYLQGFDEEGAAVINQIVFTLPMDTGYDDVEEEVIEEADGEADDEAEVFSVYAEWLPDCSSFYLYLGNTAQSIQLIAYEKPDEALVMDGADATSGGFYASIALMEGQDLIAGIELDIASSNSTVPTSHQKDTVVTLTLVDEVSTMGCVIASNETTILDGENLTQSTVIQASLLMEDELLPLATLMLLATTGDTQGAPFNPAAEDLTFVHPGAMDEEALTQWITESVAMSIMQTYFQVLSKLPTEIFSMIYGDQMAN